MIIVKEIFRRSEKRYWDNLRERHIVISKVNYGSKSRNVLAAYDKIDGDAEVITVHPISDSQIAQRLNSGRWINEEVKN